MIPLFLGHRVFFSFIYWNIFEEEVVQNTASSVMVGNSHSSESFSISLRMLCAEYKIQ